MRRLFTTAFSLLALEAAARAADLPPPPQLPPDEAQPLWTGFYAGLNVGGAFGSSRNAFNIAGFGLPTFSTSPAGVVGAVRSVTAGRPVLGSWGSKRTSRGVGSAAAAPRRAFRLSAGRSRQATRRNCPGSERCGQGSVMRSGTGSFTLRAAAPSAKSTRRRLRPSAHWSPQTIAARREAAGPSAAESKSNSRRAGARKSNIFMPIWAAARRPISWTRRSRTRRVSTPM